MASALLEDAARSLLLAAKMASTLLEDAARSLLLAAKMASALLEDAARSLLLAAKHCFANFVSLIAFPFSKLLIVPF